MKYYLSTLSSASFARWSLRSILSVAVSLVYLTACRSGSKGSDGVVDESTSGTDVSSSDDGSGDESTTTSGDSDEGGSSGDGTSGDPTWGQEGDRCSVDVLCDAHLKCSGEEGPPVYGGSCITFGGQSVRASCEKTATGDTCTRAAFCEDHPGGATCVERFEPKGHCSDFKAESPTGICEALCDPIIAYGCRPPWVCSRRLEENTEYYCFLPSSAELPLAGAGQKCDPQACDTGFECVDVDAAGAANCPGVGPGEKCCTAVCDVNRPDAAEKCENAGFPGSVCTPIWSAAEAPPYRARLGRCLMP
jgi:hypothetical protein